MTPLFSLFAAALLSTPADAAVIRISVPVVHVAPLPVGPPSARAIAAKRAELASAKRAAWRDGRLTAAERVRLARLQRQLTAMTLRFTR